MQQAAILLRGQARWQATHKQGDMGGHSPALNHVESCLAGLPQGCLQKRLGLRRLGSTTHVGCFIFLHQGNWASWWKPCERMGPTLDAHTPLGSLGPALLEAGICPTDLPNVPKSLEQGLLVSQHHPLDCRGTNIHQLPYTSITATLSPGHR